MYCLSDNQPRKQPTDEQVARTKGYPLGWLVSRMTAPTLGIFSAVGSATIGRPFFLLFHLCVQVAAIWHNVANIGDIQLIISLPNFVASNRKWAVCLPSVANHRFPPKALFPLRRGKIYVRPNIASCVFCSTTPFCSKKRLPLQGAAICSEVANCGGETDGGNATRWSCTT
ncbi:MAG: hypothetical protein KHZ65_09770 [Phocaeicola vulgatus]|nr:hypothetical protein [Phocaeicola vulgatus]